MKELDIKNSLVIHLIKCTENSIVASNRIAKYISNRLKIPLFDSPESFPGIKSYDYIFLVNSPGKFSKIIPEVVDLCFYAKRIIFVRNDYHSDLNEPSQLKRVLLFQHRWGNYFSTVPDMHVFREGDAYINWNMLTWNPIDISFENREKGLFYYGAFRAGRVKYFEKYFNKNADYDITISAPKVAGKKFLSINDKIKIVDKFENADFISKYKATIYIEDNFSHKYYCSPANRFYECLSAGIAILFDKSTKNTFDRAGYDITPYIVDSVDDVKEKLKNWKSIVKQQRKDWGSRDYLKELDEQFDKAIKKLINLGINRGVQTVPSKNTRQYMPDVSKKLISANLKEFYYWMYERQNIWYNRFVLKKERPWTDNKILNDYKFTNVYRELDYNTIWLINNVINKKFTPKNTLWKIIVFRYFNKPELFDFMKGIPDFNDYDEEKFNKYVLRYKEKFGRVFTDAYMVNPPKSKEDRELGIELFYCKHIKILHNKMNKIIWKGYEEIDDPKKFNELLVKELHCIANFLAYEIYCDLCYTDWFKWNENDFVNVGPGARFGIELIFPYTYNVKKGRIKNYMKYLYWLRDNADFFFNKFGFDFKYYNKDNPKKYKDGKRMTLRTIEHSLCEYSKYWKMKLDVGKPRKKFEPRNY